MIFKVQWLKTLGFFCCWCELIKQREYNCMQTIFGGIFTSLQYRRPRLHPWIGKTPWRMKSYPLQYSGLDNSMKCIVHGVPKSQTRLRNFHFHKMKMACALLIQGFRYCVSFWGGRGNCGQNLWTWKLPLSVGELKIRADRDAGCRWRGLHRLNALSGGRSGGAGVLEESQHVGPKGVVWVQGREDWEKEVHTYLVCLVASIQAEFTRVKSNWCAEVKNASMSWI